MKVKEIILSDYKRCGINIVSFKSVFKTFFLMPNPGLKFLTIFRLTQYYRRKNRVIFYFCFLWLRHLKYKYGLDISYRTQLGLGFYIGHFGNIVIHGDSIIGNNCNISQGVTIGINNSGKNRGVPTIGNKVFIGPGACIFGNIVIGNNVTIGANTVVTKNIPDYSTVLPAPITTVNKDLSLFYIQNSES